MSCDFKVNFVIKSFQKRIHLKSVMFFITFGERIDMFKITNVLFINCVLQKLYFWGDDKIKQGRRQRSGKNQRQKASCHRKNEKKENLNSEGFSFDTLSPPLRFPYNLSSCNVPPRTKTLEKTDSSSKAKVSVIQENSSIKKIPYSSMKQISQHQLNKWWQKEVVSSRESHFERTISFENTFVEEDLQSQESLQITKTNSEKETDILWLLGPQEKVHRHWTSSPLRQAIEA